MANIKANTVQVQEALVYKEANQNFEAMIADLKRDKGVGLSVDQGYKSAYDVLDELRKLVKNKNSTTANYSDALADDVDAQSNTNVSGLLDPAKTMQSIIAEDKYETLKDYIEGLQPTEFEPTLSEGYDGGIPPNYITRVYPYPNKLSLDPRRSGRFIKPKPTDVFKQVEVQKWLVNNGLKYGFVLYGDDALYYISYQKAIDNIRSSANKEETLQRILRRFVKPGNNTVNLITINIDTLLKTSTVVPATPNAGSITAADGLEYLQSTTGLLDNNGKALQLVIIDGKPVQVDTARAYIKMRDAALKDGVTLSITSAYRPATGTNTVAIGTKGTKAQITTQESLRRDTTRWIGYNSSTMTPTSFATSKGYSGVDDFVFRAPSSAFNPATGRPKESNHGIGQALDLNTGTRSKNTLDTNVYKWLIKNGYKYGFVRAVGSEEWHFEYWPTNSSSPYTKLPVGNDSVLFYSDLGLAKGQFTV